MTAQGLSLRVLVLLLFVLTCAANPMPAVRTVSLTAADGTTLKASYFAAAKPGPGVLLLHQCNQQRKMWASLAEHLAESGINVLTLDYRGFGESGGARFDQLTPQQTNQLVTETWPNDIDVAYQYLLSQPGVSRDVIGAGGASCGVNQSIQLARRHPEVKSLVLLSGGTDRNGRVFLKSSARLPIFIAAADDDVGGGVVETMRWLFSLSPNPDNRFERYAVGGHGVEMFAAHKELPGMIVGWFGITLLKKPGSALKTNGTPLAAETVHALELIDQPGGASKAASMLGETRQRDPQAALFSEGIVNLLGYEHLQSGDTKGALEIMKLNATAYPNSPNVYDSLSDAYLADGQNDLARENAQKALSLLAGDTKDNDERRKAIRTSAEQKLKQLDKTPR